MWLKHKDSINNIFILDEIKKSYALQYDGLTVDKFLHFFKGKINFEDYLPEEKASQKIPRNFILDVGFTIFHQNRYCEQFRRSNLIFSFSRNWKKDMLTLLKKLNEWPRSRSTLRINYHEPILHRVLP